MFLGAGEANLGIANLTVSAMMSEGLSLEEARSKVWLIDIKGLLTKNRKDIHEEQYVFAKDAKDTKDLLEIVSTVKPTTLIGKQTKNIRNLKSRMIVVFIWTIKLFFCERKKTL